MNNYEEQEINLITMFFHACKKWRTIVIGAIIIAVLGGVLQFAFSYSALKNPETFEKMKESYEIEKLAYETEGQDIQMERKLVSNDLILQNEYVENSLLMKIDSDNEWNGLVNCYIDTKYQIMPGTSIQNENPAYKIVNAYYDYYLSGGFYTEVMSRLTTMDITDVRYLKEVLSVEVDGERYALTINAIADNEEHCKELLTVATSVMQKKYADIAKQIGEHTFVTTQVTTYSQINTDRERYQMEQLSIQSDLQSQNAQLGVDYKEWRSKKGEIKVPVLDESGAYRTGLKWFIIAGVVGALLLGMFYCVAYIFSNKILYGVIIPGKLHEVGVLPAKSTKPVKGIDKLINTIFGQTIKSEEYDSRVATAALHVAQLVSKAESGDSSVALVSDMDSAKLAELADAMNKNLDNNCKIIPAGNILVSKEASMSAEQATAVVMIAEQDYTNKNEFAKMVEQLRAYDKCVLGVIVAGVK